LFKTPPAPAEGIHVPGFAVIAVLALALVAAAALLLAARRRAHPDAGAERSLAEHAAVLTIATESARSVADGDAPREAIARACCAVAEADVALVLEPDADGNLAVTAASDGRTGPALSLEDGAGAAAMLLRAGTSIFAHGTRHPLIPQPLLERMGCASALAEPVLLTGETVGTVLVGWREPLPAPPERAVLGLPLLAAQVGAVMERANLAAQLRDLALNDPLTGLSTPRAWDVDLERAHASRREFPLTVAIVDLDHFARFRDLHGRRAADRLLRELAAKWQGCTRREDLLARRTGEEFVLAMPDCDLHQSRVVIARLLGSMPDDLTCSIGLAGWDRGETAAELMDRADQRLHEARAGGRARVCS